MFKAWSLFIGLDINSPSKSITLSAPITKKPWFFWLTLFAFNSAKFFDINSGDAFSLIKLSLTISSSKLEFSTSADIWLLSKIKKEVEDAKNTFKKYRWPIIDVTRKSVEETAASIIKIYEIYKNNG